MALRKTPISVALAFGAALCLVVPVASRAADSLKLAGGIVGTVRDTHGVPQMGATVALYNRQDRPVGKVLTDQRGQFQILGLNPTLYSLRITLATFIPAIRKDILVQPGMRSVLNVSLSALFSSIQLDRPVLDNGGIMSDEWKWVLRSASDTRPVMRFGPDKVADAGTSPDRGTVFADTRGILRVSAGEGPVAGVANQADLGTAFALATSLCGRSLLEVSGNLGYGSQTGVPAAAFRTSYSRDLDGNKPVFSVTMRQLFLPERTSGALNGTDAGLPTLRSISASADNRTQFGESVSVQYGFSMDSVFFMQHLNYTNPYARLTWAIDSATDFEIAYTSGNARPDLAENGPEELGLQHDLDSLGLFPRLSLSGGRPEIQRADDYEVSVTRHVGSRSLRLSAYRELLNNAALAMVAPAGMFAGSGDVLPDLFSASSVFNAGNFDNVGYSAAFTQDLGQHFSATAMYGNEGALTVGNQELVSETPDELRAMIRAGRRHVATTRVKATLPRIGTKFIASYQWTDAPRSLMGGNLYSAQGLGALPGLNIYVRQPIPGFSGRLEATADLRNMLEQGYVPITAAGAQLLLVDNPRSFRGGLAFRF
ncbi:MAG TPA: carboxypeptidase-like regulatory domain-containing protein [Bryobacteraceae bacterium]|nr:carboxypeptidase-like regulatory domain-containing protein [Bryobacteraceae bacterium]